MMDPGLDWQRIRHLLKLGVFTLLTVLATGWISMGNLWMMGGLLLASRRVSQ